VKRLFTCILCATLLGPALAEDARPTITPAEAQPPLEVMPGRLGYAMDQPPILIRQRLFGLAHGLSNLAAACLDLPEHSQAIQDAYAAWHAGQGKTIEALVHDLARYYFGARAAEVRWQDLARALNLHESIEPSLGPVSLQDACATLPQAIRQPRYELDRRLAEAAAAVAVVKPAAPVKPAE
jgi:hypothetical protein